jgi:hypothetical protein
MTQKKVIMDLTTIDGNAYSLMGHFSKNARRQGWTKEEIDAVLKDCMSGDYNHLVSTLMDNTEEPKDDTQYTEIDFSADEDEDEDE